MTSYESSAVQFGRTQIEYAVRRSTRRRTVAVSVDPRRGVLITAPADVPISRLDSVVHRKARWIVGRLRRLDLAETPLPEREFVSGESYLYLGRQYRLKVVSAEHTGDAKLVAGRIHIPVKAMVGNSRRAMAIRKSLEAWYRRQAVLRLPERVRDWSRRVGVAEPRVMIRAQHRRWASCDASGTLRVNWRIVQAPMGLVDYVVAHELVHLRHKKHSKVFWAVLGRVMPDYERRKAELRRIGAQLEW